MSQKDLAVSIRAALSKPARDVTRYEGVRELLGRLLGVSKDEISVKVVGDVAADFKNRIGEVTGRRNTRFIAVLLSPDRRSLAEELERATEQIRQISSAMGFTGSVLMFGEIQGESWVLQRAVDVGMASPATEKLVDSLSLSRDIILTLPLESRVSGSLASPSAWLEFTYASHDHGGVGWEFGTCLWSPAKDKDGNNRYGIMQLPKPGDTVVHCEDSTLVGESVVKASAQTVTQEPPIPGEYGGRGNYYRIDLDQYRQFRTGVSLDSLLTTFDKEIREELQDRPTYYPFALYGDKESLRVPQGTYLSKLTPRLLSMIRQVAGNSPSGPFDGLATQPNAPLLENLASVHDQFSNALLASHVSFGRKHDDVVRSFLASLATKPFAILTGLSGSGKTQLALRFGDWVGTQNSLVVPVRPDWTGAEALFGYENVILPRSSDGRPAWHVPDTLKFMLRAAAHPQDPHVLILDEMNLAHVERYFADFLSGIESREPCVPDLATDNDGCWRERSVNAHRLPIPRNLFVVGTVNVDETTYMFSPKVLDRANTFEFRVETSDLSAEALRPLRVPAGDRLLTRGFLAIATDDSWHLTHRAPAVGAFITNLQNLHGLLSRSGFEFGHRVFYEATRFTAMLAATGQPNSTLALDFQLLQKVLPRLHGSRRRLEWTLCAVGRFCHDLGLEGGDGSDMAPTFDPLSPPPGDRVLPRSFDKVQRMTRSLRANQFVSFTE